jgi:CII-binding regulator of phage lambda lysogenization HflD
MYLLKKTLDRVETSSKKVDTLAKKIMVVIEDKDRYKKENESLIDELNLIYSSRLWKLNGYMKKFKKLIHHK